MLIGSFVENNKANKYLTGAIKQALEINSNCFMFFIGAPQSFIRKEITDKEVTEYKEALKKTNINDYNVCVHAPYIINICSNDSKKRWFSTKFLKEEIQRCSKIGVKYIVLHPGSYKDTTLEQAIKNCANSINEINKINSDVTICLETMSGKGSEVGKTFEELKQIIDLIDNKSLIGVCLDTCHTWDAGYDWSNEKNVINEFDKIIGLKYLKIIHLNDSLNDCGSKKDRHENIGYGKIGFKNLMDVVYDPILESIPKILETPIYENLVFTYKKEVEMIKNNKFIDWRN